MDGVKFDTPLQVMVSVMLAVLPEQAELESFYATDCPRKANEAPGNLLANLCLDAFASQTGVGIWQRVVDVRSRTLKLSFAAYEDLIGGPRRMLKYSPCYSMLTGFSDASSYQILRQKTSEDLQVAIAAAHKKLVSDMMSYFWERIDEFPYVATPSLRTVLDDELRAYLASGLNDAGGGFLPPPSKQFSFFLYGGPGTGKSTMVAAFSRAFQATLSRFIDSSRRADIVKVPLNGLTPESLGMILRVQGISDMSIERLLEQAVSKGNTAILHLEEIPETVELQEALVSTVKSMLETSLLRRYHHYTGNVILAYTSNYPAAPQVAANTTQITVVAPSPKEQWNHCVRMLESHLREATGASEVAVYLKYALPLLDDMRPLCQWWTTLAYHIARRVKEYAAAHDWGSPPFRVGAILSSANGGGMITVDLHIDLQNDMAKEKDHIPTSSSPPMPRPCSESDLSSFASVNDSPPNSPTSEDSVSEARVGRRGHGWSVSPAAKPLLTVSSMDGFFFVEGDGGDWGASGTEAEKFRRRKNSTVLDMTLSGALKPGVVVLTGGKDKRVAVEEDLLQQAVSLAGKHTAQVVRVDLRKEEDKDQVNGHQSQIRGGLFKVIDDFNNQNMAGRSEGILVIVCNVNETGQYMLRELLETNGESRTHRFAIRKDRVLFVLSLDADAGLQEMTISRAHALIDCS